MKINFEMSDTLVEVIVRNIMENFPEASYGCALQCEEWGYDHWRFVFRDTESGAKIHLNKHQLIKTFPLIFTDKWPKGCTQPPFSTDPEVWDNWLCQADATDFDAFVQLACLGEVIYG